MFKKVLIGVGLLSLTACSGTNLADQFFSNQSNNVAAVDVVALWHLTGGVAGEISGTNTKTFTNDLGYEIELVMATTHYHQIKLISSGSDPQCIGGNDQEISIHGTHNLLGEDLITHHMGTGLIPAVNYCEFELQVGHNAMAIKFDHPGDGDGDGGGDHAHGEEGQEAFHFMGTWSKGTDSGNFMLTGSEILMVRHEFKFKENGEVIVHPLHFAEGETVRQIFIGFKYDEAFNGVDFLTQTEHEQIQTIYENLSTVVHQHTGDHHGSGGDSGDGHHS